MSWTKLIQAKKRKDRNKRIVDHYQSVLNECIQHANSLYKKRYIFRHAFNVLSDKIRKCQAEIIQFRKRKVTHLKDVISSLDTVVYSCGLGTVSKTLEYFGVRPLPEIKQWVDTLCTPVVISRERGNVHSTFFRAPAVPSTNSIDYARVVWYSVPGRNNRHFAFRLIVESDICERLPKIFNSKLRLLSDSHYQKVSLLPEKAIVTESLAEIRARIENLLKIRERLGKTPISKIIQEFLHADLGKQVQMLTAMIIREDHRDLSHLVTIIYDISANRTLANRRDVPDLIDALPWVVQRRIRELRQNYAPQRNIEEDDIPTETRIQMLHTSDSTKKLAMTRLKEANVRSGGGVTGTDGSSKAGLWVEELLKIPFGTYRKEPILCLREATLESLYSILGNKAKGIRSFYDLYTFIVKEYSDIISLNETTQQLYWNRTYLMNSLKAIKKISTLKKIASELEFSLPSNVRITKRILVQTIVEGCSMKKIEEVNQVLVSNGVSLSSTIVSALELWNSHTKQLHSYIQNTKDILNSCVYKQDRAKEQILRVLGQWMVGENTGYCLGFEGKPGVGKTTLAREGVAKILTDADGNSRPFHMIALGSATTGSTLIGHNYTFHGSTCGDIVRILMESHCMNPIIYVDELDKVSRTESGREIIGILTHLTDPAQNEEFVDRYFAGVKLDLSRVLFIFSYNDASMVDPILLDRIHRIQFGSYTVTDKINIATKYSLPQICKNLNLPKEITRLDPDLVRYIVQNYTNEPGVRKLREILYDTFREINLRSIQHQTHYLNPTIDFIEEHILRHRVKPIRTLADLEQKPNRVYGMFATSSGLGGILPIKVSRNILGKDHDIKLTGSLGDVMKESVSLAQTVVSHYCDISGPIHIHFPEGAVPKNGPSAGTAITLALYSYYTNTPIPGDIAITGEIDLDGNVLPVGGIQEKLTGAKADNVTKVFIPKANERDFRIACENVPREEMPETVEFIETFEELLEKI